MRYAYCRVSTEQQHLDRQIEGIKKAYPDIKEEDIFVEKISGRKKVEERSEYAVLRRILRSGDELVLDSLDRLSRTKAGIKAELEYLKTKGIIVRVLVIPTTLISLEGQEWAVELINNLLIELYSTLSEQELREKDRRQRAGIEAAKELPVNEEGYVVCDSKFNRVKVKSPTYVNLHHIKGNGVLSFARGIDLVRDNELEEVLTYFPEFAKHLDKIRNDFENAIASLESAWKKFEDNSDNLPTRKDQAMFITSKENFGKNSGIGFCLLDKKVGSVREWFMTQPTVKVMNALGYKDKEQSEP